MKTKKHATFLLYILLFVCGSISGQNEEILILGGSTGWRVAETRNGVTEIRGVRPYSVITLSSATGFSTAGYTQAAGVWGNFIPLDNSALDMSISFDENSSVNFRDSNRRYSVIAAGADAADRIHARAGTGAVLFGNSGHIRIQPQSRNALLSSGNRFRDFSIEFWLHPFNMDNGERIITWTANIGTNTAQRITCTASRNRLSWSFTNFFTSTSGTAFKNLELTSRTPIQPKTWSHHLIRFDASTGMLEYLVNGESEAIVYATSTGRENGEVYTPVAGNNGVLLLGERFAGLMDEFKIHEVCAGRTTIQKYPVLGGRMETRPIDLGNNASGVVRVDASGGRFSLSPRAAFNDFRENGSFRFSCDAEMSFYIRASENPYNLNSVSWLPFTPGANVRDIRGRYVQIAVDFFPSSDGENSPYLQDLRIVYLPGEPPIPPRNVTAVAADGGVMLSWRTSPSETKGYLVYYSSVRGELFGTGALQGASPVDVGNRNRVFIDGLQNGTLYYFRIAAYDEYNTGEFSAEVTARPLTGLSLFE